MIYYNLEDSKYLFKYDELLFYFSSKLYLEKFKRIQSNYILEQQNKARIRYKCRIYGDYMFLLLLYKKIETRGFRVLYKNQILNKDYCFAFEILDSYES